MRTTEDLMSSCGRNARCLAENNGNSGWRKRMGIPHPKGTMKSTRDIKSVKKIYLTPHFASIATTETVSDKMDAFPASPSSTVRPVSLSFQEDAMEHVVRQRMAKAFITYQEPKNKHDSFSSPKWFQKKTFMDNFKHMISDTRVENWFDP
ncbi:hypothetical protein NPIL_480391 [Nephila pilipes]|uniref:Uncharacterized protein n=1 Tax=Nephila pilipes TaxID=299642 RepID=A0A8X6UXC1_NEPPI|nr:hypothetical protein NPIL_480391 [Nephila pilipes]